ncbi:MULTISPECIES: type III-B CRISPR-associated protein Cas10/Cmr2 [unclassified Microcoleus]|uniref:Cas10/Cmr2 second palm domain-containing protein n=1 Tax=unclassified Microcoleus TaxID=2642155 RepID=UPI002FD125BF
MSEYTAISFAPVQGFIEKSRKLRDLFGASLILSYLSSKLVEKAECLGFEVISPGLPNVKEGMPNRILVRGDKVFDRDTVRKTLLDEWQKVLEVCRTWVEQNVPAEKYHWSQTDEQKGRQKGEWERWGSYTWEVFWGTGKKPDEAMRDLERRKLKRDWTAINWIGESSSLTGTDAIAWHQLGKPLSKGDQPGRSLTPKETQEQKDFYQRLSQALETSIDGQFEGKFLDSSEKLSIPELVKRLVTRYDDIGEHLAKEFYIKSFSEMVRLPQPNQPGHWTGWFMGDGDEVGKKLKELVKDSNDTKPLRDFSDKMRKWGIDFKHDFPRELGRVVYAGGDDFLGVIYSKNPKSPISTSVALKWLMGLNKQWNQHGQDITVSVGFVWAGHSVPQRDILQHCREAQKRAKSLGRKRVTIRVVFNSGQSVQWTCPWDYLDILTKYRDRDGKTYPEWECRGQDSKYLPNWTHIYNDWAELKARHAIHLVETDKLKIDDYLAINFLNYYFDNAAENISKNPPRERWNYIAGDNNPLTVVQWIDDLIQVGWQLCSNT